MPQFLGTRVAVFRILVTATFLIRWPGTGGAPAQSVSVPRNASPRQTASAKVESRKNEGAVLAIALSFDGRFLAAASTADSAVHVWSTQSGKELAVLRGHLGSVNGLGFSPNGAQLVSAGADGTARVWEMPSGKELRKLRQQAGFEAVTFNPDGRSIATAGVDGNVRIWSAMDGALLRTLNAGSGTVSSLCYLANTGTMLLSGDMDGESTVWNPANGEKVNSTTNVAAVNSVALGPDGKLYLAGLASGTSAIVSAETGHVQGSFYDDRTNTTAVAIAPDMSYTLTGSQEDKRVRLRMIKSNDRGQLIGHTGAIRSLTISPDSQLVLTGSDDGSLRIWSAVERRELLRIEIFADGSWTMLDGNGHYDGSELADKPNAATLKRGLLPQALRARAAQKVLPSE